MTYGIELTQEQMLYTQRIRKDMPDWQRVELTVNRVSATFALQWRDIYPKGEGDTEQYKARKMCIHALSFWFGFDFIGDIFGIPPNYAQALHYEGRKLCDGDPVLSAILKSIHHDIKYNLPCN